jgi:hypothetical protein
MVIEHIIAGNSIPHNEGAIPLTKESYDIKEPQKRSSDYSKTITIPEDNVVNQIFEHAFDVNVLFQTFDPNIKTSYQVIQDGVTLIDGYCRLVDIVNVDGKIEYKIQGIGKIGSVFESIKDLYLTDIDFTDLDHVWNETNIVASWSPTIGTGYVYPMIDYGGRTSYREWITEDFKPAIFVREYIMRMFNEQGFTISSAFFDTTLFKSLIIPFGADGIALDNVGIKANQFYVTRETTDYNIVAPGVLVFNDDSTGDNYNTALNEFSTANGIYTALEVKKYSWQGVLDMEIEAAGLTSNQTRYANEMMSDTNFSAFIKVNLIKTDGVNYPIVDTITLDVAESITRPVTSAINIDVKQDFSTMQFYSETGLQYYLEMDMQGTFKSDNYTGGVFNITTATLNIGSVNSLKNRDVNFTATETISMAATIPKDTKQSELLGAIIKRFNLYLYYDAIDENLIYIEPRDDYYTDVKIDVSEKIDRSKEITISPIGALDASTYLFEDKEDKDVKNKEYQDLLQEPYGRNKVDIDNDFIKNERKVTSIFSPTPLITVENNGRVISAIQFQNEKGQKVSGSGNIRILYWGGTITNTPWILNVTPKTVYPYAGHLDNPYAPTFDLNWGIPKKLFYNFSYGGNNIVTYPNNNCYNLFWKNYIEEITSKDSKLLTCYIALRPTDYADYNFRQSYYIDGQYFRLIKIVDYDPNSNNTTKCIFLKQAKVAAFVATTKDVLGGTGVYDTGEVLPGFLVTTRPNRGGGSTNDVITFGDNVVSGQRSIIVSDNISGISTNKNVFAIGSNGSNIQASDVTLINSPNTSAHRDGDTFINGLYAERRLDVVLNEAILENISETIPILPALAADEFYQIIRGYARINGIKPTVSTKLTIQTAGAVELASLPDTFFDVDNNTGIVDIASVSTFPFGQGLQIISTDFESPSATTVQIQLVYRIIKI